MLGHHRSETATEANMSRRSSVAFRRRVETLTADDDSMIELAEALTRLRARFEADLLAYGAWRSKNKQGLSRKEHAGRCSGCERNPKSPPEVEGSVSATRMSRLDVVPGGDRPPSMQLASADCLSEIAWSRPRTSPTSSTLCRTT
jgi:hypothetical protein